MLLTHATLSQLHEKSSKIFRPNVCLYICHHKIITSTLQYNMSSR